MNIQDIQEKIQLAKNLVMDSLHAEGAKFFTVDNEQRARMLYADGLLSQALEIIRKSDPLINLDCKHSWRFLRSEASRPFDPTVAVDQFYCVRCLSRRELSRIMKPSSE